MKHLILVFVAAFASLSLVAQEKNEPKNEFKVFYGERITRDITNFIGNSLVDALSGMKTETNGFGMYGVGYRYSMNRLAIGGDVSWVGYRNDVKIEKNNPNDFRVNENYFVILPSADFTYLKSGILRLYGTAGVGATLGFRNSKSYTQAGADYLKTADYNEKLVGLAFQVNPIGIRLGSENVGAFVEAGFGMKGVVNAGISIKF